MTFDNAANPTEMTASRIDCSVASAFNSGDDEQIFGYKGLIIRLRFAAHDLRPHVHISYDERFKPVGDTTALDLLGTLKPFIPQGML